MSHKQTLAGIDTDLFTYISVEGFYNMFKYLKIHRCVLNFDRLFLRLLVK